ncbi:hypothetical protein HHI36_012618 [Cryptolaemus montrouzieri]|uniref:Ionotropic glutamate receptor C-terminal domain-containing protein n=1 Tax=Cryptolaemus montrouzieri TaxID=559131 RepID=A0ABD2NF02_9CUCU
MLNSTYQVVEPPKNSRYDGAISDILKNKTDFCFVRHLYFNETVEGIEYSAPKEFANLNILIPKPNEISRREVFLKIYCKEIWFSIIISLISLLCTMKFIATQSKHKLNWSFQELFMDLFRMLLNQGSKNFQEYNEWLRTLVVIWIWCCLILFVSFQTRLIYLMQNPIYENGITTLEELKNSKLPLYSSYNLTKLQGHAYMFHEQYRSIKYLHLRDFIWKNEIKAAFVMSFAVIRGKINPDLFPDDSSSTHVVLPEVLTHSFSVYMFPKRSPYNALFTEKITLQKQFGFSDITTRIAMRRKSDRKIVRKLSFYHMEPAFFLLFVGYFLSCSAWILEFFLNSHRN